jgi:predicted phosphodiesterase
LTPQNQAWVLQLPPVRKETGFWLTHASPLWPDHLTTLADLQTKRRGLQMSGLFPYLHFESPMLWDIWGKLTEARVSWLFHGHTHRQITWRFTADNHIQKLTHSPLALRPGETLVVGVGSVGRPEDGPGAAYVIFDDTHQEIEMVRVV